MHNLSRILKLFEKAGRTFVCKREMELHSSFTDYLTYYVAVVTEIEMTFSKVTFIAAADPITLSWHRTLRTEHRISLYKSTVQS